MHKKKENNLQDFLEVASIVIGLAGLILFVFVSMAAVAAH